MENKEIIIQHNDLISGRHNWTTNEIKIVLNALTKVNIEKDLIFKFTRKEIIDLLNDDTYSTRDLKDLSKRLHSKSFEISEGDNRWKFLHWFREIDYNDGVLMIEFEDRLKPYLLNLKKNFTKYNIQNILPMKSNYSMRIYQLLKQYQRIGSRKFNIDDLRDILKIPKSYTYNNIKKSIILKAEEEMNKYSDITFDFEEIKTGRKITDIKFIIKKKENHSDILDEMKEENPWYYSKYYGKNVINNEIEYENVIDIKENDKYLTVIFEDKSEIRVKNEELLIQILKD